MDNKDNYIFIVLLKTNNMTQILDVYSNIDDALDRISECRLNRIKEVADGKLNGHFNYDTIQGFEVIWNNGITEECYYQTKILR